jgi:hypothetical protein
MSIARKVRLPNGVTWAVGSCVALTNTEVIIPLDTIGEMTDAQIGAAVRSLITEAHLAWAINEADYVLHRDRMHTSWDNTMSLDECQILFTRFQAQSQVVAKALDIVIEFQAQEQLRKERRNRTKAHRSDITANYERLFITLGRRDGFACAICQSPSQDLSIDHIQALANGGTNDVENLQLLCRSCNSSKGAR